MAGFTSTSNQQEKNYWRYEPKEDITPYELALITPLLIAVSQNESPNWVRKGIFRKTGLQGVEQLPSEAQRHFHEEGA